MNGPNPDKRNYHHGNLAGALLQASVTLLREKGPALLSLREVARLAGVSHGAPAHHFGDKAGLLTAVAIEGHGLLARQLRLSQSNQANAKQRLYGAGEAYIRFAVQHPAHFSIMFQSNLIHPRDPDYLAASAASKSVLEQCVLDVLGPGRSDQVLQVTVVALWSQVHGFASLWLAGNLGDTADHALLNNLMAEVLHSLKL